MFKGHLKVIDRPVRFSVATARMYMKIAVHPILSNRNLGNDLPPSWRTLYELTFLPDSAITEFIAVGFINPEIGKDYAIALRFAGSSPPVRRSLSKPRFPRHFKPYADNLTNHDLEAR